MPHFPRSPPPGRKAARRGRCRRGVSSRRAGGSPGNTSKLPRRSVSASMRRDRRASRSRAGISGDFTAAWSRRAAPPTPRHIGDAAFGLADRALQALRQRGAPLGEVASRHAGRDVRILPQVQDAPLQRRMRYDRHAVLHRDPAGEDPQPIGGAVRRTMSSQIRSMNWKGPMAELVRLRASGSNPLSCEAWTSRAGKRRAVRHAVDRHRDGS